MMTRPSKGITLVEVIAALALAGTVLVSLILSGSSHLRQVKVASGKIESVDLLDRILMRWSFSNFRLNHLSSIGSEFGLPVVSDEDGGETPSEIGQRRIVYSQKDLVSQDDLPVVRLVVQVFRPDDRWQDLAWVEIVPGGTR